MAENEKGIYRSLGTKLKILGSGDATVVAGLTNISGPSASADEIDITTLDSEGGYRSFIAGFKDAGEISIDGYLITAEGKGQAELYDLFESGETADFAIVFPSEMKAAWKFKGIVTAYETTAAVEDPINFSSTVRISGKPEFLRGAAAEGI